MPSPRLPWQPHPEGGFIAYPEGWSAESKRYARLKPFTTGPQGSYTWSVAYDGQSISSVAGSKQLASDAANAAWPGVIEKAAAAGAKSEWERTTLDMIGKAERGEIEPGYFANEAATYENMMWVMRKIAPKSGIPGSPPRISAGLQRLVDALSVEFARRRAKASERKPE
jgi:hypothetical protein